MFFLLSKFLLVALQPFVLVLAGLIASYALLRRGNVRGAKRMILGMLVLIVVTGVSPAATALMLLLEDRFPRPQLSASGPVAGIIVLGGGENARITRARGSVTTGDAAERMSEAMALSVKFPAARIVFTGGSTDIVGPQSFGADAAAQFFREQGLDMRRLVLERQSRNTHENAVFTKALVEPRAGETWLLVTSAFHMPRSMGVFRKVGWDVTPWPVDYRTEGGVELQQLFVNPADGVYRFEIAIKEWVGMLVYRSTGRSDALFPAPAR